MIRLNLSHSNNFLIGEGSVAALRTGRNTIAMTTMKEDFLLVKRDISMKTFMRALIILSYYCHALLYFTDYFISIQFKKSEQI